MPREPLVHWSRFTKTRGMICPNASVTIARYSPRSRRVSAPFSAPNSAVVITHTSSTNGRSGAPSRPLVRNAAV